MSQNDHELPGFPSPPNDDENDEEQDTRDRDGWSVNDQADDNEAAPEEALVTLSVVTEGSTICFAAYNDESREIWIEECLANGYEVAAVVERVIRFLQPTLILVSKKMVTNETLLSLLTTLATEGPELQDAEKDEPEEPANTPVPQSPATRSIPYQVLGSSAFDVHGCKTIILQKLLVESTTRRRGPHEHAHQRNPNRHFPGAPPPPPAGATFAVSRYHALASLLDMESTVQIQALGSLVSYLHRTLFSTTEGGFVAVRDIVRGNLSLYMNVPPTTLSALHIFATERHPLLAAKGTGRSKEGFSLFSLMDRTKSRMGRQRLREWMLKPLVDVDAITNRQNGVELFLQPAFQDTMGTLLKLLERIGAIDKILQRMEKGITQPQDFGFLVRSIKTAIYIYDTIGQDILWPLRNAPADEEVQGYLYFIEDLLQSFAPGVLQSLSEKLTAAVDETATHQWDSRSIVIRDGFSEELDMMRDQYDQLGDMLQDISNDLCVQYPHLREFLEVAFFPQIGFLIRLQEDERWTPEGVPNDFEFVYAEGGITSFKDNKMRELDVHYGDLDALIKDKESLIVAQLEDEIMSYTEDLHATFGVIADLDCILSLTALAFDTGYVRPNVVPADENCILISNGRHPLQEMILGNAFVPNDTEVDEEKRVNMITGPNFSGKSCYARQVGVLVYMAHLGSFLPCEAAKISIVQEILVRFSAVETCTVPQSTFQIDLSQMGTVLRMAGPGSLVLIDEFGKGTSPASGISLLAAAIHKLAKTGAKVICTTHFVEAFSMGMLQDREDGIAALQMAVKIPEHQSDLALPLFKLENGVADSSAGLVCARMAGLRQCIVSRASEIIQLIREGKPIQPLDEIFRSDLPFSIDELTLLRKFVQTDWYQATDEEIQDLLDAIHRLQDSRIHCFGLSPARSPA